MACIVMAYIVMGYIVMAHIVMAVAFQLRNLGEHSERLDLTSVTSSLSSLVVLGPQPLM